MMSSPFKPAWWLPHAHLQTLWPTFCRRPIKNLKLTRERIELTDGDFIDVDWSGPAKRPIVILLHGLEGSLQSAYAKGMLKALVAANFRAVFFNFRGCSGENNRLPRAYHSGATEDLAAVVDILQKREPATPLLAIGFSLGGNVLLKWLGETKANNPLSAAVAISVPFELHQSVERVNRGFSRIYQWHLLRCLQQKLRKKFSQMSSPIPLELLNTIRTLRQFDDLFTAPLHGFKDADDYYTQCSSKKYLKKIAIPTLILHAKDDPFMMPDILPNEFEISSKVTLEMSSHGGHVGFVAGIVPFRPIYWLEKRIPHYLCEHL